MLGPVFNLERVLHRRHITNPGAVDQILDVVVIARQFTLSVVYVALRETAADVETQHFAG